ncbi:hypothetical protein L1987_31592 [Smallanthus sonchifolius]|uniref:Uncharacterized protein n=1 Tax=Smallanthus sonchifolius TaxID=185202 RepID=A0ACB9I7J7_9ASTR|nr:hypothetical protein L1987_31592 [Smallanthus sonchifolius]
MVAVARDGVTAVVGSGGGGRAAVCGIGFHSDISLMSMHEEEENENVSGDIEFRWGRKGRVGAKNPNIQYYESFTYDGVEHFLYDSVYLWCGDQQMPCVVKIVEMYETPRLKKMMKVVWYFHPAEVQKWLRGVHHLNNELFLASGEGNGLYNFNPLETICGKCNVVCTSKDERNPKASMEELKMSDYVFYRTFDVETCRLSEKFPDKIAGVEVGHFFNPKPKGKPEVTGKSNLPSKCETDNKSTPASSDTHHSKKRKLQDFEVDKKRSIEADNQSITLKKRPKLDTSEWFKKLPWEDRIRKAHQAGSLVLLENLYHSFTPSEVEETVLDAFNIKVSAKMIQWSAYSSPHNGQALVIFNSKDEADFAISELNTRCLIIGGARIVVGSRPSLKEPGNHHPSKYFGHIAIDAVKRKQLMDMKNAVSTAHHAQPNTITFDMAMEWRARQKKWELCWDALYKNQAEEIASLKARLKGSALLGKEK